MSIQEFSKWVVYDASMPKAQSLMWRIRCPVPSILGTTKLGNSDLGLGLRNTVKDKVRVRVRDRARVKVRFRVRVVG